MRSYQGRSLTRALRSGRPASTADMRTVTISPIGAPATRTGAKFSAWPEPSRSTSTFWRRADQALQARPPCGARTPRAGGGRAPSTVGADDLRHARRRRARFGEKGKMWPITMSQSSIRRSLFSCIASVSVGKPAMRSAPIAISGRFALSRATVSTASARLWRRFIRFSTMSSPAWKLMWRCGMKRGSPVARSNSRSSISMQSSEERRSRGSSGTCLQDALDQLARGVGAPGRSGP